MPIPRFVGWRTTEPFLELHPFRHGEPYTLGIFLTGEYQEILDDLHNLFGDTNAVHLFLTDDGGYEVRGTVHGDTVTEVLEYVHFDAQKLVATFRKQVRTAKGLSRADANAFVADRMAGLAGYPYLEGDVR